MKVILDTNFLIDSFRFKVDLKKELAGSEVFMLKSQLFELRQIEERGTSDSKLAKMALMFAKNVRMLEPIQAKVDDSLVSYSKEGYAIATHDRKLKEKLKGAKIVYIRQKRYLENTDL
jgi:rRNA-processing protein FCF1